MHQPAIAPSLRTAIAEFLPDVVEFRRDLHRHPELMFEESRTADRVCEQLEALGIPFVRGLAPESPSQPGTGIAAYLQATVDDPSKAATIGLRADMDALPITESTGLPYSSTRQGVMHACGHDGHTATLLGVARALAGVEHRPNNIVFCFQPAEEGGAGGEKMCADGAIDGTALQREHGIGTRVDMMFGLHGWPELELGKVATRTGPLLAATDEFEVTVRGRGGHAAQPERSIDPVVVAAHIVTALQTIASRRTEPNDAVVVTVGAIHAGEAHNVIPDTAHLRGTIRTLLPETRTMAETEFRRIVHGIASSFDAGAEVEWHSGYPVTFNDPVATDHFRSVARTVLGDRADTLLVEKDKPTMGGEDFSYYGHHCPACFFLLGLRPESMDSYPNVHTPKFDFNDDAIALGIELFCALALSDSPTLTSP
ncbi:MAG: M20 metallopeptidase family protein [Phycisphaerales bacterium]